MSERASRWLDSIKIGGLTYKVIFDEFITTDRSELGNVSITSQTIRIAQNSTIEQQEETLLHEVVEVINSSCDLDLEHNQIATLSYILYQVLKDNQIEFSR